MWPPQWVVPYWFLSLALFTSPFTLLGEDLYLDWLAMWIVLSTHTRKWSLRKLVCGTWVYIYIYSFKRCFLKCLQMLLISYIMCHWTVYQLSYRTTLSLYISVYISNSSVKLNKMYQVTISVLVWRVGVVWFTPESRYLLPLFPKWTLTVDIDLISSQAARRKKWLSPGKISYRCASK